MTMTCPACQQRIQPNATTHVIVLLGEVCFGCFNRMHRPTRLDGCVSGEPHAHVCERTAAEFERRRVKLLQQARDICQEVCR